MRFHLRGKPLAGSPRATKTTDPDSSVAASSKEMTLNRARLQPAPRTPQDRISITIQETILSKARGWDFIIIGVHLGYRVSNARKRHASYPCLVQKPIARLQIERHVFTNTQRTRSPAEAVTAGLSLRLRCTPTPRKPRPHFRPFRGLNSTGSVLSHDFDEKLMLLDADCK